MIPFRLLALAMLLLASGLQAQPLAIREAGAVRFVSGGIGEEERAALEPMRAQFNLHLTFAVARSGNYLADVGVTLRDAAGCEVLSANAEGPWFLARLAPGRYTLAADYGGKIQARALTVRGAGRTEMYLYWDDPAALEGRGMEPERAPRPPARHR